ncbi:unnamed protein product [Cyprideis torosa]|uniref:Alanine--glyoxylate aminotransferase 2, mitochondrial n=1 Tax=Cyprideis torosa TaxID=163714 RepID=A0A7R8ZH99_9CRUS|nr:unnamed protein product [Cyprideis torosa]CAG0883175.1 unnamed protein product [Cyprideis torosa]
MNVELLGKHRVYLYRHPPPRSPSLNVPPGRPDIRVLETFGQTYPDEFDGSMDCISVALTCAFNPRGSLLAVGCNDGRVVIWDFVTRGIARVISAHVHPVAALSWSRSGHKLLSTSTDNTVCIWKVLTGDCLHKLKFPWPCLQASFHPRCELSFLVLPMWQSAILFKVNVISGKEGDENAHIKLDRRVLPSDEPHIAASFSRKGTYAITGDAKGHVAIYQTLDLKRVSSFRLLSGAEVRNIEVGRDCFAVNASDRVIRVYSTDMILSAGDIEGEPEPLQKLQDMVNKTMWKKCCFSYDDEYICAAAARSSSLYIWERSIGNVVKILQGTKGEVLLDVVWHPSRPIVAAIAAGVVSIWKQHEVQSWTSFAPEFKELDENVEYDEDEGDFDEMDEDKTMTVNEEKVEEAEEEIDVVTVEMSSAFADRDPDDSPLPEEDQLLFIPQAPEIEDPEDADGAPEWSSPSPIHPKAKGGRKKGRLKLIACDKMKMSSSAPRLLRNPPIFREKILGSATCAVQSKAYCSQAVSMPPCDFQPTPYTVLINTCQYGRTYEEIVALRKKHLHPIVKTLYYRRPLLIHQGHKQWLFDHEGKRYLDMFAGIVTVSVGHGHPKVQEAAEKQMRLLGHTTHIYMFPKVHEYAEKLASKMPEGLNTVMLMNSGSEANDMAVKMARLFTGRLDFLSHRNGYHGMSPSAMALTAISTWRHALPPAPGIHHVMNPDVFKGPWGGRACRDSPCQVKRECSCTEGRCQATDQYVEQVKDTIVHSTSNAGLAGYISEPIQGVGGTVQLPRGYLPKVYELVRSRGGVCVSDEVQTGFGRTGSHFWGFEGQGVTPDIVTMAKGIGNGYPLAAVVTRPEIAASINNALYFNTYGGNPVACAVGEAVLDVIEEEGLQENCRVVGTHLLEGLKRVQDEFPQWIGDVRGKGLMVGVELIGEEGTTIPLPAEKVLDVWERTKELGVLFGKGGLSGNVLRLKPPMCINKADADFAVDSLRRAIKETLNAT